MKFYVIVLILFINVIFANTVGIENAQDAFNTYIQLFEQNNLMQNQYQISTSKIIYHRNRDETIGYIFHLKPTGVFVVSANTTNDPIVYYSFENNLDTEIREDNVPMLFIQTSLEEHHNSLRQDNFIESEVAKNQLLWQKIQNKDMSSTMTVYGPHLDTNWDQYEPYYNNCPEDPRYPGTHCVTGCVATAMAQIINYFEFPPGIYFTEDESYDTYSLGIHVDATTATIASINYNASGSHPNTSTISALCFATGVSVEMDYSAGGSSASADAATFMGKWQYGYARDIEYADADFFSSLSNSMIASKPANMSISYYDGGTRVRGHAVVCDGYNDGTDTYHLNFGWSGTDDGWYTLPSTLPPDYNTVEDAIVDITEPSFSVYNVPGDYGTIQAALNVAIGGDTVIVASDRYSGAGNTNLDFNGKPVYLRSQSGAPSCTLDCGSSSRAFIFDNYEGRNTIVDGFTIYDGYYDGNGGGIDAGYGTGPFIQNCIFAVCEASSFGGGVNAQSSSIKLVNNVFIDCSAWGGGALYTQFEQVEFINNTFVGNSATNGGAIYVNSAAEVAMLNNLFWDNTADQGTAVYLTDYFGATPVAYMDHGLYPSSGISNSGGTMLYGSGNVNSSPSFHDGFKRLAEGSDGIDDGASNVELAIFDNLILIAPDYDLDNIARPEGTGYDIGAFEWTTTTNINENIKPLALDIKAYPNPFNSAITIDAPEIAKIVIYDVNGKFITKLPEGSNTWQPARNTKSGVYLIRINIDKTTKDIKALYIK
ncbi:MAG: C10 family peptidase [Candidatus Zixiibacteriota bacterium]